MNRTMTPLRFRQVQTLAVWLQPGDIRMVAEEVWKPRSQVGRYTEAYVAAVARGERFNARIWEALWRIANENRERIEQAEKLEHKLLSI